LGLVSLVLLIASGALFLASCKRGGADAKPANVDYYTCTMHPSVKKESPTDKCPICSMDLTPVAKKGGGDAQAVHAGHGGQPALNATGTNALAEDQPTEFTVAVERQQQIGVTYGTIEKRPFPTQAFARRHGRLRQAAALGLRHARRGLCAKAICVLAR